MTGVLETQVHKRATREKIQNKVLIVLTRLTTQSSYLAFAPEAVLIKKLGLNDGQKWKPSYQIRQALRRLEKKGLVRYQRTAHGWTACLSPQGEKRADMHLGQGVLYIIAEGIENDYQIRKHFDLS